MNDGWLCDSILKTAASPSPMSTAPAFSPGPCSTCGPFGRQRLQVHARALVAAVLGPHHREDAELGEVRLAAHERDDALVLVGLQAVAFENLGVDHACWQRERASADASARTTDSKITQAVDAAEQRLAGALGMRHQADDVAPLVADAGDRVRPIRSDSHAVVDVARRGSV